jgi:hypothetical protein
MAVEILILSGARQGEQLMLEGREFRVGSDPSCEIFFDPERDRAMHGRSAVLRRQEDGWYIRCTGGEALVNHQPVVGWMRVRSGDVVRMSESGPDFSFGIVAGAAPTPARLSAKTSGSHSSGAPASRTSAETVSTPASELAPLPEVVQGQSAGRPLVPWAVGGVVVAFAAFFLGRSLLLPPTVVVIQQPSPSPGPQAPPGPVANSPVRTTASEPVPESKPEKSEAPPDIAEQLKDVVFLLQVEKSGHRWPFATCVAIGKNTLLTTAREASHMAQWREKSGFKFWVTRPTDGFKEEEVRDIRIYGVFVPLADKPNDWIYFDSALLTIRGDLPKAARLASREELAALERGAPVSCFGFSHEGEEVTRYDKFEARLIPGKIKFITAPPDLPGRPRLLHVKAEIPKNAYGSAVVNAEGGLIGLYGEVAATPPGAAGGSGGAELKNLHYVTMVNPEMINLWLRDRNAQMWPVAAAVPTTPKTQDHP